MYKKSYYNLLKTFFLIIAGLLALSACSAGQTPTDSLLTGKAALNFRPGIEAKNELSKTEAISNNRILLGQLLIISLRWDENGRPITQIGPRELKIIKELHPGGISLFAVNLKNVEQTRELIRQIQSACDIPPFIAIDEEGGRVSRLATSQAINGVRIPAAQDLGAAGSLAVWTAYDIIGQELASLGVNMDFAPVADLRYKSETDIVGDRAFSGDPNTAAESVSLAVQALQKHGICSVLKHYPGHGRTEGDSHFGLQKINANWETLKNSDLVPFMAAIQGNCAGIMTAHIEFPQIDSTLVPVSMSKKMVTGKLRDELQFKGLVITDALDMQGILRLGSAGNIAVTSINAGVDMLLCPENALEIRDALAKALESGNIQRARLIDSYQRILAVKNSYGVIRARSNPADDDLMPYAIGNKYQKAKLAKSLAN